MKYKRPILLVEDSPDDADLTKIAFDRAGVLNPLIHVDDGEKAVEYLTHKGKWEHLTTDDHPLLILLDLKLPRMSGFDVLKTIKGIPPLTLIPVVILTSSKEHEDVLEGYKNGCNSYVRKPVDFAEFINVARELGLYWIALNQNIDDH